MRRHRMSKRGSKRNFRKYARSHKMNRPRKITRGGFRI